jgi:hypothetical protein
VDERGVRLKALLRKKHWQKYATFCREYDKAAEAIDPELVGGAPGRAQLHRWLHGELKGLPYPDHCRVLEKMFPGYTAAQLFEPIPDEPVAVVPDAVERPRENVFRAVAGALAAPGTTPAGWDDNAPTVSPILVPRQGGDLRDHEAGDLDDAAQRVARRVLALAQVRRLSTDETERLAAAVGNVVDLDQRLDLEIAKDGAARLTYRHELFNASSRPLTRYTREIWFEYTNGPLVITPVVEAGRRVTIERIADAGGMAKIALQLSPALKPGETASVGYSCEGGLFADKLYWRQSMTRHTMRYTLNLRHRGAGELRGCTAVEEHPDGEVTSADDSLIWDYEGRDVMITLTRDLLRPNQAVTLRWDLARVSA